MSGGIYKIQNLVNGKCYVGSAKSFNDRFRKHKNSLVKNSHHSIKLQRAWNKYGSENFVFQPLLICKPIDLLYYEQRVIDSFDSYYSGYNATIKAHSKIGMKSSKETCAKISAAKKGINLSESHKKAISDGGKGRVKSQSEIEKVRIALTGKKKSPEHVEKMRQANIGKKYSDETKAKVSASLIGNSRALGNKLSDETKQKMSESHKGKAQSPEWIEKRIAKRLATIAAKKQGLILT